MVSIKIRKPRSPAGSWRLYRDGVGLLAVDETDRLSQMWRDKQLSSAEVISELKGIRERLYRKEGNAKPLGLNSNYKILEAFWRQYKRRRRLRSPESALTPLKHAVAKLGPLCLVKSSEEELQERVDKVWDGAPTKHNRYVTRVNMLLKFLGRGFTLAVDSEPRPQVVHVTEEQVILLSKVIKNDNLRLLHLAAFYTGARLGELMAVTPDSIKGDQLLIKGQVLRDGRQAETKTGNIRQTFIIPSGAKYVKQWALCGKQLPIRRESIAGLTRRLSQRALGTSIKFHDLRHSYAIHLLSLGVPLDLVALSLGDDVRTAQRYYVGYSLTNSSVDLIRKIVGR